MVAAVIAGTAALLADGGDPAELRRRVSSPAGTTVEGLAVLERGAVRAHLADAVRAAARRAGEL
jgi:pyrroline-5-carboxylate reductase